MTRLALGCLAVLCVAATAAAQSHDMPPPAPAGPPPPLYADLGTWSHPVTTASPEAQRFFDQGLRLCFGFNHDEATRAFREAARLDPNCAMAWWGVAYAAGPNINLPMDEAHARVANEAIARAKALRSLADEPDRAWIDALAARYSTDPAASRAGLDSAYARAMQLLAKRYPQDFDAAVLSAEALLDLNPWNQWAHDGTPNPGTPEVVAVLEAVLQAKPDHPGANHFYIHAVEASPTPERALPSADRLGALVPGAGHLVHMPAHVYARTARYDDAVKVNQRAVAVDEKYIAEQKPEGIYPLMYTNHNIHFIWFGACMEGRYDLALSSARKVAGNVPAEVVSQFPMVEFLPPLPALTLVRFGRWDDALEEQLPPPAWRYANGMSHFARGLAWAAKGDLASARAELDSLRAITQRVPADQMVSINYAAPLLRIGIAALEGEIELRAPRWDRAFAAFRAAVAAEDSLHYDEPPTWYMPERQRLGAALLKAGRPAEAEAVYRDELRRHPENGWSLHGLAGALRALGKNAEAETVEMRLRKAWARADVKLAASSY